jgi:hypothetical protein
MTTATLWTVNTIKDANRVVGGHWFDPDTMRCFGTRVLATVYQGPGGIYFVTSDHDYARNRCYSVRRFDPATGDVSTVGDAASLTKGRAVALAHQTARGTVAAAAVETVAELFRPVSADEQFLAELHQHGNGAATINDASTFRWLATTHLRLMEEACNGDASLYDDAGVPVGALARNRHRLKALAAKTGATAVMFQGDPRGCTVKLIFADGATNNVGGDGWCVPTGRSR